MLMKREFLIVLLLCGPFIMSTVPAFADGENANPTITGNNIQAARASLQTAYKQTLADYPEVSDSAKQSNRKKLEGAITDSMEQEDFETDDEDQLQALEDKKQNYEDAKANEQSLANRSLTAASIATTGIGGMELAMGLSEQKADKAAAQDMAAYIATMRCTYGDDKQVKAGSEEIELPGGNDQALMNLRNEYFALATDLKERKTVLNMKPGIESEEILDKASSGLYDDESLVIDKGAYESLYRAQMLASEEDQSKLDAQAKEAKNRVIAGAVIGGVGVVGSVLGNSMINGKLGEKIKEWKEGKSSTKENESLKDQFRDCLKSRGYTNVDKLDLSGIDLTDAAEDIKGTDCNTLAKCSGGGSKCDATKLINTSNITSIKSSFSSLFPKVEDY